MKHLKILFSIIFSTFVLLNCSEEPKEKIIEKVVFETSLHCEGCVNTISTKLPKTVGVEKVDVELETKLVTISFDKNSTSEVKLKKELEKLGYDAEKVDSLSNG
ncbi:MAG: heavy-metal-associated domain-containing protein [Melioribacteraceae bacterium]|nr:heavy-metal-associated domain-containing protein [Melioribacteraceae bacterium]